MGSRALVNTCVAAALVIRGIIFPAAYGHWLKTRTFTAADVPVSLSRGQVTTNAFHINLRGEYLVEVQVDYPYTYKAGCDLYGPASVINAHLKLFRDGRQIGETDSQNYFFIASFDADKKGLYRIDIDVLSDASCLNDGHPRLVVLRANSGSYEDSYEIVRWLSFILILCGFGLLVRVTAVRILNRIPRGETLTILGGSDLKQGPWPARFPPAKLFSGLPSFGFLCSIILLVVLVAYWAAYEDKIPPKGLWVSVLPHRVDKEESRWPSPLVVRLEFAGPGLDPKLYLNSKLIPWGKADDP
jgi:hypothetical protein